MSYFPLDESSVVPYLKSWAGLEKFFDKTEELSATDLADGNVNLVFRVQSKKNPAKSILVKQALPYARRYPDFKMPLERAAIENGILEIHNKYCPGLAPKNYHYDSAMFVQIMEDLNAHHIMRDGIMKQVEYPNFSKDIGMFMARSVFYTTDFFLDSASKKKLTSQYCNPVLCKVSEDLVFTFPYQSHATNRFPEAMSGEAEALWCNDKIQTRVRELKALFMTKAEALIHGDLHTGSIMLNNSETKVIDAEFGFVGPIGYDIGNIIGNLAMAHASQAYHCTDPAKRKSYQKYLSNSLKESWEIFTAEWKKLWNQQALSEWQTEGYLNAYLSNLEKESLGFAACEMTRRTLGMAHIPELDTIQDQKALTEVSKAILHLASSIFLDKITSVNKLSEMLNK